MISRWQWLLLQLGRRLWVRVTLFSVVAVLTALLGAVLAPVIPGSVPGRVGADALDNILSILATSMLAVTTFSLTTMVTAYTAVSSNATPRSSQLLMDDPTTQNTLGTFIGSFLFSLVGIILSSTGAYGDSGRLVLFVVTIAVIILIVVTLLRWIDYLSTVARVGKVTDKVEAVAAHALRDRKERPCLGGRPLADPTREVPDGARAVYSERVGYVQHIDIAAIDHVAAKEGGRVFMLVLPGSFVDPSRALARVSGIADEAELAAIVRSFTIGDQRSFDQDPRFGLCVLAEIASRALSPGINDPGTAIDVIGSGVRLFAEWLAEDKSRGEAEEAEQAVQFSNVWVSPLATADLLADFFDPIARDGAGLVEIQVKLQKAFVTLRALGGPPLEATLRTYAARALAHAEAALVLDMDKRAVRELAAQVSPEASGVQSSNR
jgi:uncharacterized membrane protein